MPIVTEGLRHVYAAGTPLETTALAGLDLTIADGETVGIIGPTGSGKTTLVQHFNGLLKPTSGRVLVDGVDTSSRRANMRDIRRKVGLIFQYPEHQLFEETVAADVAFGPKNLGLAPDEVTLRVDEALRRVGLDPAIGRRSPYELSGGQMRRVAIAGVLAMRPRVVVLDEPTAGLDPRGRDEILGHLEALHGGGGVTLVIVSHNMRDIARLARRVVALLGGRVALDGPAREVLTHVRELRDMGLGAPPMVELMCRLRERGHAVRLDALTVDEARREILRVVGGGSRG